MDASNKYFNKAALWRRKAAEDQHSSAVILKQLSNSSDAHVRLAVAENENTPLELVLEIAGDADADLRYTLAGNHNIASSVLCFLADDSNPFVADRASRSLARLAATGTYGSSNDGPPFFFGIQSRRMS